MATVELPKGNTVSADMKDGTRYYPDSSGLIEVNNKDHLEQIRQTGLRIRGRQYAFTQADDVRHACGFVQLAAFAQPGASCPRCHEPW